MASSMLITDPKDRRFFDWLINTNVFTRTQFNAWEKPEEGRLMPVLLNNSHLLNDAAFIKSGLSHNPNYLHIPSLQVDPTFIRQFPKPLFTAMIQQYDALPLAAHGLSQWFCIPYFFEFDLAGFCDMLNIDQKTPSLMVITPSQYQAYYQQILAFAPDYNING
jgi:hypothetical protein